MKTTRITSSLFVASLLLVASAVQGEVIRDPGDSTRAIAVENVDIGGTLYNVSFPGPTEAFNIYGDLPGVFPFTTFESAAAAVNAVVTELNLAGGIFAVGGSNSIFNQNFNLIYATEGTGLGAIGFLARSFAEGEDWTFAEESDQALYNADSRVYAFVEVVPEPSAVWLSGSALAVLGWLKRRTI
jgi:hypothetical protein